MSFDSSCTRESYSAICAATMRSSAAFLLSVVAACHTSEPARSKVPAQRVASWPGATDANVGITDIVGSELRPKVVIRLRADSSGILPQFFERVNVLATRPVFPPWGWGPPGFRD